MVGGVGLLKSVVELTQCERQEEDARRFIEVAVEAVEAAGGTVARTYVRPGCREREVISG